mmetsp:Transcript_55906/g.120961  ORF Transcript_55906/g.120961 Transcript_55906/m.120961 type:complete len:644 (+) Transcript_55906:51-1982(+)
MSSPKLRSQFRGQVSPLFDEYLGLAEEAAWEDIHTASLAEGLGPTDALIVVDMQKDFVPMHPTTNPDGGAFGVNDGDAIEPLVVRLMEAFAAKGGAVVATRDYHPSNHCSFVDQKGPFPPHCIQGSVGTHFCDSIGQCIKRLRKRNQEVAVVFKGFHEDVDSFGSFPYPDVEGTWSRVTNRTAPERLHGCSLAAWTGSVLLDCSNAAADVNAPPDVLSIYRKVLLGDWLKKRGIKRIFACGLALDFCVLDTCLHALKAGFAESFLVLDVARAGHLPGIGSHGSGFLSDPKWIKEVMTTNGARLVTSGALLPNMPSAPISEKDQPKGKTFPEGLGPFSLVPTRMLLLELDRSRMTYKASQPEKDIQVLEKNGLRAEGSFSPINELTLPSDARKKAGIPAEATHFFWANPVAELGDKFGDQVRAYFSITTPSAAFFVYGGFVYLDAKGAVVAALAVSTGSGLNFEAPRSWPSAVSVALDRWQPVTVAFLRDRGARLFAWLNPGEKVEHAGQSFTAGKHGGFAYLFHSDLKEQDDRDIFFDVAGQADFVRPVLGRVGSKDEFNEHAESTVQDFVKAGSVEEAQVAKAFKELDAVGSGIISQRHLGKALAGLGLDLPEETLSRILDRPEFKKDGGIDYLAFVDWVFA